MWDAALVFAFVIYSVGSGLRHRATASSGLEEYFLAGRTLKGWQAGLSMAATQFAADTPLLVTGLIATAGLHGLWRLSVYGLSFLWMAYVLGPAWRRSGVLTDAELVEVRYSGRAVPLLRGLKAVYYGIVVNAAVLAMVLVAAVRMAEVFLPWHLWLPSSVYGVLSSGVAAVGMNLASGATDLPPSVASTNGLLGVVSVLAFTAIYSATGGLRTVVATDVVQVILALGGSAAYAWVAVGHAGGLGGLVDALVATVGQSRADGLLDLVPSWEAAGPFVAVVSLQWVFQINADGTGYLAQRTMACASDADAQQAGVVFAFVQVLARTLIWVVIGLSLLVIYPLEPGVADAASREMTFVRGMEQMLPAGIRGVMLVAMLAALASTLDTHLNWGASYVANDLYHGLYCKRWRGIAPSGATLVRVARASMVGLVVLALVIMRYLGSIQEAWHLTLLLGAGMGGVLLLRWLWWRINLWSELLSLAASVVAAPVLLQLVADEWLRLVLMAAVSTATAVGAAMWGPATDPAVLQRFYTAAQPPGAWGAVERGANGQLGRARADLARRATLWAWTAVSLYLAYVGSVWLLVPMQGWQRPAGALTVACALLATRAWWPALRAPPPAAAVNLQPPA